jgi:hypothetical protein
VVSTKIYTSLLSLTEIGIARDPLRVSAGTGTQPILIQRVKIIMEALYGICYNGALPYDKRDPFLQNGGVGQ